MNLTSLSVSLYIKGKQLDPARVTSILGVSPTFSQRLGDQLSGGKGVSNIGVWAIEADTTFMSADQVLLQLVQRLPNKISLSSLPDVEEVYVDIFVATSPQNARFDFKLDLSMTTLTRLVELDAPLQLECCIVPDSNPNRT